MILPYSTLEWTRARYAFFLHGCGQWRRFLLGKPSRVCLFRPKIKFYLFAIAYLPTHLSFIPYSTFFFCFSRSYFFFFFFFAVSIFQFQSEMLNLYKWTRKKPTGIAFIPHFLSLFLLCWLSYLFTFHCRRGNFIQSNLPTKKKKKNPDLPTHSLNTWVGSCKQTKF